MSSSPTDVRPPGAGTVVDVLMPQMGTSVAEGTVVAWRVAPGDPVQRDQVLCEVSTDKVDVECPSPAAGVVTEVLVDAGETVDVGVVIARLRAAGGPAAPAQDAEDPASPGGDVGRPTVAAPPDEGRRGASAADGGAAPAPRDDDPRAARRALLRRSSPVAARLAAEHGVDVRTVAGSGRNGRVTKRDVLAAAAGAPTEAGPPDDDAPMHTESPYRHDPSIPTAGVHPGSTVADPPGRTADAAADVPASRPPEAGAPTSVGGVAVPATRMRRAIGEAVRRSLDTAAHCTTVVECDMTRVERERREQGLTALPLVARATIAALHEFPALNATFDGETIVRHGERVHLGIAVSLGEDGLIAPVIHDAQDLSAQGLARRIRDLATRARSGDLRPDEVRGGTFTITNPGAAGALIATPVINLPQVAILDLEAIVRRPVVVTDPSGGESIGIRPMVHLCMGWDHRALDGLYAARFLTALRGRLEG